MQGYTEYMAMLLVNGSDPVVPMVPLQLNTTQAAIAAISSNKIGRSIMVRTLGLVMPEACTRCSQAMLGSARY